MKRLIQGILVGTAAQELLGARSSRSAKGAFVHGGV
jgi:hypothetical protein